MEIFTDGGINSQFVINRTKNAELIQRLNFARGDPDWLSMRPDKKFLTAGKYGDKLIGEHSY